MDSIFSIVNLIDKIDPLKFIHRGFDHPAGTNCNFKGRGKAQLVPQKTKGSKN